MAVNRYSNRSVASFNPMSMEQIFVVPMAKRQQHDAAVAQAIEAGVFDVNRLAVDDPRVTEIIKTQQGRFDDFINRLNTEGFNRDTTGDLLRLNRDKQALLSNQGELGRAQSAYNSYQANQKELQDMYKKGKISAEKYRLGLQSALQGYKGIAQDDVYSPFAAVADTDYVEKARKIANDIRQKPDLLERAGYRLNADGSMYIQTKTGHEFTREGAISDAVANILMADQAVISDLSQRERLGMLGKDGMAGTILSLANTLERDYSVDRNKIDIKLTGNKAFKHKEDKEAGIVSTSLPATHRQRFSEDTLEKLDYIANNDTREVTQEAMKKNFFKTGMLTSDPEIKLENTLDEETAAAVRADYEQLLTVPGNTLDPNASDQEIARTVKQYRDKYKNVSHSNKLIQIGSAENSLDGAAMVKAAAVKDPARYASLSIKMGGASVWDLDTKELVPIKDLKLHEGTLEYAGTFSSDNTLEEFEDASPDELVVPDAFVYTDEDGDVRRLLISKPDSVKEEPSVKAAALNKHIFTQTFANPAVPQRIPAPIELQKKGVSEIIVGYNPAQITGDPQEYVMQVKLHDGSTYGGETGERLNMQEVKELLHSFYVGKQKR